MQISHAVSSNLLLPTPTQTQISSLAPYARTSSGYIRFSFNMRYKVSHLSKQQAKIWWKSATIICNVYCLVT